MSVAATAAAESKCSSSLSNARTPRCLSKTESGLQAELYSVWAIQSASRPPPLRRPSEDYIRPPERHMGPFRPRVKKLLTPDEVPNVEMALRTAVISDAQEDKGM